MLNSYVRRLCKHYDVCAVKHQGAAALNLFSDQQIVQSIQSQHLTFNAAMQTASDPQRFNVTSMSLVFLLLHKPNVVIFIHESETYIHSGWCPLILGRREAVLNLLLLFIPHVVFLSSDAERIFFPFFLFEILVSVIILN